MKRTFGRWLGFSLLLLASVYAYQRAQERDCIGIDFVQFHLTGQYVVSGSDPHVYSDKVRSEILQHAWKVATSEGTESKFYHAVNFRHERTWETYSSPFLYAMFGATGGRPRIEAVNTRTSTNDPSSGLSATFFPDAGKKGRSEEYEGAMNRYWVVCLGSTMIGFITFGWVLRIPGWSMLMGAVCLVWFSPLRIDMNVANVNQIQFGMVGVLAAILGGEWRQRVEKAEGRDQIECANMGAHHAERDGYFSRQFLAGVWLSVCLAFKPSLLWCGIMWLGPMAWVAFQSRERRKRMLKPLVAVVVGGILGGMIAGAFSAIWFPLHCWVEWIQAVRSLPDEIIQTEQGNFSTTYFARSNGIPGWLLALAGPMVGGMLVYVMGRRIVRRTAEFDVHTVDVVESPNSGAAPIWQLTSLRSPGGIANYLAIGCLIHLLTSHLVWYHYGLLSLPAVIVVAREVVTAASWRDALLLGGILLWCVLLLGLQPVDEILASPPNEHFLRCTFANVMLLVLVVMLSGGATAAFCHRAPVDVRVNR